MSGEREWLTRREKGSVLGMRFVIGLATLFGRGPARLFLGLLALYYVTFHRSVRRSLDSYYLRVAGSPASFRMAWRHVHVFAQVALDRFFFAKGRFRLFAITRNGDAHLERLARDGRGAILLSAHLGSQAAMRVDDSDTRLRINVVGYFKNARMINALLARMNPTSAPRVVNIEPGSVSSVLALKELVERGELLAIAGDRTGLNERSVEAEFLGAPARFPAGPFILAAVLRCPVYLTFAVYRRPNRYELFCEPLCEALDAPRATRDGVIRELVQRYADRLGHYCRIAPDNWFNFFDFWKQV